MLATAKSLLGRPCQNYYDLPLLLSIDFYNKCKKKVAAIILNAINGNDSNLAGLSIYCSKIVEINLNPITDLITRQIVGKVKQSCHEIFFFNSFLKSNQVADRSGFF